MKKQNPLSMWLSLSLLFILGVPFVGRCGNERITEIEKKRWTGSCGPSSMKM
jgi:hypothetical protein